MCCNVILSNIFLINFPKVYNFLLRWLCLCLILNYYTIIMDTLYDNCSAWLLDIRMSIASEEVMPLIKLVTNGNYSYQLCFITIIVYIIIIILYTKLYNIYKAEELLQNHYSKQISLLCLMVITYCKLTYS